MTGTSNKRRGAILLEVVLALVLFTAAATVIGTGLSSSVDAVDRLRYSTHAANLAATTLAETELGLPLEAGPQPVGADFPGWTREITTTPWGEADATSSSLSLVEVIIRHESGFTHRMAQVMELKGGL